MAEIQHLGVIILAQVTHILSAPGDFTFIRLDEAAQSTQQAGLAAAILTLDLQDLPGIQRKAQSGKQTMITATTR